MPFALLRQQLKGAQGPWALYSKGESPTLCFIKTFGKRAEKADGFVNLPDFTVEKASECKKKHAFKISHPQIKTFYFAAENVQEMNLGRQSWIDMVNSSSAAGGEGQSVTCAVQVHSPAPSEANSRRALEDSLATSESGFLNSISSDDTSSLSSNLDPLTVPDKPPGSKMTDREETKVSEDDEMEKLYKSLEQASLSPLGDRRPSTKKELRKSFVKRCKNPSINEKLHKIRTLNSTLKCKEHDLAMINQLLDDPKLTARKYREWKVVNTLLIQDIYQQQRAPTPASEGSPQGLEKPPPSACVENSI
ncbi:hypothetical protein CB1_000719002 [Camelus ferus]|nr:hypothetical protein CB1_000719002 [Camelus ferus]